MVRGKSQALLLRNFQTCAQHMWYKVPRSPCQVSPSQQFILPLEKPRFRERKPEPVLHRETGGLRGGPYFPR